MKVVGQVESLWRYPVKSMRGEELREAFVGFGGVYGDRLYAFRSSAAPKGFPYLTAREQQRMLLYQPAYEDPSKWGNRRTLQRPMRSDPESRLFYPDSAHVMVHVKTPAGELLAIDDPRLISMLREGIREVHELTLHRSDRAMTDCRPLSLFSIQTARQLSQETGADLDKRRFRANVYVDIGSQSAFEEDEFVGKTLRIGTKTMIAVVDRDPRCKMITLDPDTAEANPEVMRHVALTHGSKAGVYAAVLVEGTIRPGDEIALLN